MTTSSDPFVRHGLDHLSPSSLRLWRECPAVWIGKYLLRAPDEMGAGAWRGRAVEAGVDHLLYGQPPEAALRAVQLQWDLDAQGVAAEDAIKEYEALTDFLTQAMLAFANKPIPLQRQAKIHLHIPGISIPLTGFADWLWPEYGTDLKTTWRIPGSPDPEHVAQVSCYAMFHGVPFNLTYVSPKKWVRYEVTPEMASEAYDRVIETAHAIRSFLAHVSDGYDALSMFSPNYDSYFFRPPMAEAVRAAKAGRILPAEPHKPDLQLVKEPTP